MLCKCLLFYRWKIIILPELCWYDEVLCDVVISEPRYTNWKHIPCIPFGLYTMRCLSYCIMMWSWTYVSKQLYWLFTWIYDNDITIYSVIIIFRNINYSHNLFFPESRDEYGKLLANYKLCLLYCRQ